MSDKTYTEAEFNSVVSEVEGLKAQLAELTAAAGVSQIDAKVAEAVAGAEAQAAELQTQLDAAVLEAQAAKDELKAHVDAVAAAEAAAAEAAELATRKDERVALVKEHASFPDEYLESNADRFAAMSDEAFEAALTDWKAIAKAPAALEDEIPAVTAMTAARSTDGSNPLAEVLGLRAQGVDARTVN